jgi:hypothetical protein
MVSLPTFSTSIDKKKGIMVAVGTLQPTSRSQVYKVRIDYRVGETPDVRVLSPELVPLVEGGKLKHVYRDNRLCLYTPGRGEWTGNMSFPQTVVPWISEWLLYYELWHATGEWLGGGTEPEPNEPFRNERHANE